MKFFNLILNVKRFVPLFFCGLSFTFTVAQDPVKPERMSIDAIMELKKKKPWDLNMDEIKEIVNMVTAGQNLKPAKWQDGNRVAVMISFDFDTETTKLRYADFSPSNLSRGNYGARRGIPRILNLLEKYQVPSSFFVPGVSAILHIEEMRLIMKHKLKHEIGVHGWIHEVLPKLTEEEEVELMKRAYNTIKKITGTPPLGYRSTSWDFNPKTLKLVKKMGFLYDSSLMGDNDPYELLDQGEKTGIIEMPVEWILDDFPYFHFDRYGSSRPHLSPNDVLEIWKSEFDGAYKEGGMFILTMHPQIIGHRSRIAILEQLLAYISSHDDVWFTTIADAVKYIKRTNK